MTNDIIEKLRIELAKPITEESQVIYILSRVRKIIEIDRNKNQGKYQKLKFYCDWALHAEIEKGIRAFKEELEKFIQGDVNAGGPIITYQFFETDFLAFLSQYGIPSDTYLGIKNNMAFKEFLALTYNDTPLIITFIKKFRLTTNKGIFTTTDKQGKIEIGYRITPMD